MLFFVKGEMKGVPPIPPEQILELAVKEAETVISYQKQGKVLAGGFLACRKGGCSIWNVDSIEELHTLVSQLPLFTFLEWEIIPLITREYAMEGLKKTLAALRASK